MADSFITAAPILDLIAGDCLARRQPRGGIRYVSVAVKLMNLPTLLRVVSLKARCLNSMADSSTTARPILDLIAVSCWARRQLRCGIGSVLRRQFPSELQGPG